MARAQRVAIARALLGDPAIVFADEPSGNVDSQTTEEVVQLFLDLNKQGSTIVMITHDRDLAQSVPRVVEILDGDPPRERTWVGSRRSVSSVPARAP